MMSPGILKPIESGHSDHSQFIARRTMKMLVLIGLTVVSITFLQPGLCRPHRHQDHCKVTNIPIQENFDLGKVGFTVSYFVLNDKKLNS